MNTIRKVLNFLFFQPVEIRMPFVAFILLVIHIVTGFFFSLYGQLIVQVIKNSD